jgi:hypothetical protein
LRETSTPGQARVIFKQIKGYKSSIKKAHLRDERLISQNYLLAITLFQIDQVSLEYKSIISHEKPGLKCKKLSYF